MGSLALACGLNWQCVCAVYIRLGVLGRLKLKKAYFLFSEGYGEQNVGSTKEFTIY